MRERDWLEPLRLGFDSYVISKTGTTTFDSLSFLNTGGHAQTNVERGAMRDEALLVWGILTLLNFNGRRIGLMKIVFLLEKSFGLK